MNGATLAQAIKRRDAAAKKLRRAQDVVNDLRAIYREQAKIAKRFQPPKPRCVQRIISRTGREFTCRYPAKDGLKCGVHKNKGEIINRY